MNIGQLNTILGKIADEKSREQIIEFAFALVEWMGIEPNAGNRPQLLAPQTQKLKEYLLPAPQTVQPQLYRLTAEGQGIRVRFAVLKKLKKDYLNQLVDNDPGLGSYQAAMKGIVQQPGREPYISPQPYFIHFITTPDYDKLVLVFNQGDQKRVVSFRNRLTHTQYNKIVELWHNIAARPKPEIADLFWKSLDIKEVNKRFYQQIKERFDALLGFLKAQQHTAPDDAAKQFAVRLIGRYIFCWFLKEKGIIPHALVGTTTIKATPAYYQSTLLKLFFETLNTKVQDRDPLTHPKQFEKIPYLNGGLFDISEEDKLFANVDLDAWLLPFVEILESYDFTVDESSSQYQQVAVDPEMLGRIFENLLASQNAETEKLANQRKAFGAFYTPREIVDYMVAESLKAHLQTRWEQHIAAQKTAHINNPPPVGDIFGNKPPQQLAIETKQYQLKPEEKAKIETAIAPLFAPNADATQLKSKEDKNLLLGFLAEVKILDPACGSGAFPMGILHKLVELHEALGTVKSGYELKKDILSQNIYGVDIMPMAIEIARLRAWLSLVLEEDYKPTDPKHNFGVKPLPNLDFKFVCANSLIDSGYDDFLKKLKDGNKATTLVRMDGEIQKLEAIRDDYFDTFGDQSKREKLRQDFNTTKNYIKTEFATLRENWKLADFFDKIDDWNPFDDSHASSFFSPSWMFGKRVRDGFDVVIGNPPYGGNLAKEEIKRFRETYDLKTSETAILFIEKGTKLLKTLGVQSYIIPKSFTFASNYNTARNYIEKGLNIIVDCGKAFEEVKLEACIFQFKNGTQLPVYSSLQFTDNLTFEMLSVIDKSLKGEFGFFPNGLLENEIKIGKKISSSGVFLKDVAVNRRGCLLQDYLKDEGEIKVIGGKEIDRYGIRGVKGYVSKENISISNCNIKENSILVQNIVAHITKPISRIKIIGCLPNKDKDIVITDTLNQITLTNKNLSPEIIWSLLSSTLINWFVYLFIYGKAIRTMHFDNAVTDRIPIPNESKLTNGSIIKRVQKTLSLKSNNQDTTTLEKEIDVMVYKLYELTYDEVKIIDPAFWLSDTEYNEFEVG